MQILTHLIFLLNLLKGQAVVYFCQPELPFDAGFCEVTDYILPMIFGLAGDGLDQAANVENIIFLLFGHGWIHSSQRSGSAKRLRYES